MLKLNIKRLALFPLLPAAGDVLAHPGSHAEFGSWEQVAHFLSNPDHIGIVTGVALLLATVVWSAVRGR